MINDTVNSSRPVYAFRDWAFQIVVTAIGMFIIGTVVAFALQEGRKGASGRSSPKVEGGQTNPSGLARGVPAWFHPHVLPTVPDERGTAVLTATGVDLMVRNETRLRLPWSSIDRGALAADAIHFGVSSDLYAFAVLDLDDLTDYSEWRSAFEGHGIPIGDLVPVVGAQDGDRLRLSWSMR